MINSYAYDIEVLPNFFSITIVDIKDYLKTFANATKTNAKGKSVNIPLTQVCTVKEIKEMLNNVKKYTFWISDTDDSQLFKMLKFINDLSPHYDENHKAVRNDLYGYNSSKYDKLMIAELLMNATQANNTKELINKLYMTSKEIIRLQDSEESRHSFFLSRLKQYGLPYTDVDVMSLFALNKVGKSVDKNGNAKFFGKSLKQTSINLQWYELLEHELPPIGKADEHFYAKNPLYKGLVCEQLNSLINKWDRYIIPEWIDDMMKYNLNDVFIVCEIIRLYMDEIRLRYNISKSYGVDVLSSSRSQIADKLFIKFYSQFSGLYEEQWRGRKTEYNAMPFRNVIFNTITFKTDPLKELLSEMKRITIYNIGKSGLKEIANKYPEFKYLKTDINYGWFEIKINNLVYTIATGGLHSQDIPRILKSKIKYIENPPTGDNVSIWDKITDDSYIFTHADVSSFYPSLMCEYNIAPRHLSSKIFVKLVKWLRDTRIQAKHSKNAYIDGIPADLLAQVLKIVINSVYGKLGFKFGDLYDRLAVLKVTINGQLLLLKLCEELELNGIEVYSANTDGIVVKVYKSKKKIYDEILERWQRETKLGIDSEEYKIYCARDINNYCIEELNGKVSYKGDLHPTMYANDLQKGYSMPVVAKAVCNYFLYDKPVIETLQECTNILDFCLTQNVGRQFHVEFSYGQTCNRLQQNVRFYVSNNGGRIEKVHNQTNARSNLCAGNKVTILNTLDDIDISMRNIKYQYYYNEAIKIIDPIKLNISPNQKSGKTLIKKYSKQYLSLFDDENE